MINNKLLLQAGHKSWIFQALRLQKGLLYLNRLTSSLKCEFYTPGCYCPACYTCEVPSACSLHYLRVWTWGLTAAWLLHELPSQQGISPSPVWRVSSDASPAGRRTAKYNKLMFLHLLWLIAAAAWGGRTALWACGAAAHGSAAWDYCQLRCPAALAGSKESKEYRHAFIAHG